LSSFEAARSLQIPPAAELTLTTAGGRRRVDGEVLKRAFGRRIAALASLLFLPLLVTLPKAARADGGAPLSALKAAYTLHFLNLVEWKQASAQLHFCVLGESEAGAQMLSTLNGKSVHGQRIRARRVPGDGSDRERCDALYIPESYAADAPELLKQSETTSTLTISDVPGFVNNGGVIGFVVVGNRLRFDVNERAASKKRLKISAKLLELAREVVR
jgi:hypothetical protein